MYALQKARREQAKREKGGGEEKEETGRKVKAGKGMPPRITVMLLELADKIMGYEKCFISVYIIYFSFLLPALLCLPKEVFTHQDTNISV